MARKHEKAAFIEYNRNQCILPIDIEVLIPENHMVGRRKRIL